LRLHTASEVISLARKLEGEAADFYEGLCQYHKDEVLWRGFARENRRNIAQVERAYYGVISDAIESGFAFDIDGTEYVADQGGAPATGYAPALGRAARTEELMARFYATAATQSQSLLADLPRLFRAMAEKRLARAQTIGALTAQP
jgi:rubrerythrin